MANTTVRFDPSIVVDTQFRVARNGSIIFEFYDSDGNPEDMYESEWEFILKLQANSPTNVLRLTTGGGNILVQGSNDERVVININYSESNITAYNYYYEIYRPDLKKTWFTGTCFVSNGQYNASVNQDFVSTTTDEQVVRIELSSTGSPVQVTLGSSSVQTITLAELATTLQTAAADTPLDADTFNFYDAVDAVLKKVTWANVKATLKTYFDTLYTTTAAVATQITMALSGYLTAATAATTYKALSTTAVALTDAATIDITGTHHTLATALGRTFTISYTGDSIKIAITLSATSATYTLPTGHKGIYNGTPSGTNTLVVTGAVSGDVILVSIEKLGTVYYWVGRNAIR